MKILHKAALIYMLINKRFEIDTVICTKAVLLAKGYKTKVNMTQGQVLISIVLFIDNFIK